MKELRKVTPANGSVSECHDSKLKRVRDPSKIPLLATALLAVCVAGCLVGCPTPPRAPPAAKQAPPTIVPQPRHLGRPYDVTASESLLTILVYRGGALAKAGHNHVIASHTLRGSLYVPVDLAQSTFEVHMPVTELTVDEPALRANEHSDDFPPDVPDSAKEGTRHNMLSPALLDGDQYPEIVLRSERLERASGQAGGADTAGGLDRPGVPNASNGSNDANGSRDPGGPNDANRSREPGGLNARWLAHIQVTVRDKTNTVIVPVHFDQHGDEIEVSGEFPLKQSDLGLTPFSALLGALQVVDEMKVRFHIVAHAAVTQTGK
jgi:polyisoprenoid-binding protein YceI